MFYNQKYIAKITNPFTKPVFDNYKADIYWNKINRKKGHHTRFFFSTTLKSAMTVNYIIFYFLTS